MRGWTGDSGVTWCCEMRKGLLVSTSFLFKRVMSLQDLAGLIRIRSIVGHADFFIIEEPGKCGPTVEHVIHGLGHIVMTRQLGLFGFYLDVQFLDRRSDELLPQFQTLSSRQFDQFSFQIKDYADQTHGFAGQRRETGRSVFRARAHDLGDISQYKEFSSALSPTYAPGEGRLLHSRPHMPCASCELESRYAPVVVPLIGAGPSHRQLSEN